MPFIEGQTFQEAIREFHRDARLRRDPGQRGLELRNLLQRLIAVCNTIAYAHDQGVLHRDLKPANIMLGPYGETLVMDWGLAKRLESGSAEAGTDVEEPGASPSSDDLTAAGAVMGTPQYMSPEQASGKPSGPPSDLYALGVILYAILTGASPYRESPPADPLKPVREAAFVPPQQRDPGVPGPLAAICQKAMAARPEERYASASPWLTTWTRLAGRRAGVRRPIGRGSPLRLGRWGRAPASAGVQAGAAALAVTALFATTAALVVDRARRGERSALIRVIGALDAERAAKAEAEANLTLARQAVDDYFTKISENALLKRQDAAEVRDLRTLRRELLEVALDYYTRLIARRSADPSLREELAAAYTRVGRINEEIGSSVAALAAYEQARTIWTDLAALHPADTRPERRLAESLITVAAMLASTGHPVESLEEYTRSERILRKMADANLSDLDIQSELARAYNGRGIVLRVRARPGRSPRGSGTGRSDRQAAWSSPGPPTLPRISSRLATDLSNIGLLLNELGRTAEAVSALEESLLIYRRPGRCPAQRQQASERSGGLRQQPRPGPQRRAGRASFEALTALKPAVASRSSALVRDHPSVTVYRRDLATNHINSGNALSSTNQVAEALAEFERCSSGPSTPRRCRRPGRRDPAQPGRHAFQHR